MSVVRKPEQSSLNALESIDTASLRLAAIVESSDDAIVSKNLDGIIVTWNQAAERLFGWKAEEIIGRSVLTIIPNELQSEEPEILRKLRAGERIDHYETRRMRKDGTLIDVSLTVSPIKDHSGKVIGASKIARDITEQKKLRKMLIDSEKLAATGRMAAAIAHEINNPLESVTNLAYLLSIDPTLNETARQYADTLLQEVSRASEITRQTLAFYRDSSRPVSVSVGGLINNVLELNRQRWQRKRITVRREYDEDDAIIGYPAELRQVLANLLLNALDAVPEGGRIHVRVRNAAGHAGDRLRVSIADTGCGIPIENRMRLFEPFFTTKGSAGNGLGLWISRGIVEKHGGLIRIRSRVAQGCSGTVFSLLLPRR